MHRHGRPEASGHDDEDGQDRAQNERERRLGHVAVHDAEQDGTGDDGECIAILPQGLQQHTAEGELFDEGRNDGVGQEHPGKLVARSGALRLIAVEGDAVLLKELDHKGGHEICDDDGHDPDADGLHEEDAGLRLVEEQELVPLLDLLHEVRADGKGHEDGEQGVQDLKDLLHGIGIGDGTRVHELQHHRAAPHAEEMEQKDADAEDAADFQDLFLRLFRHGRHRKLSGLPRLVIDGVDAPVGRLVVIQRLSPPTSLYYI